MEQIEKTELAKVIQKTEVEATYQLAKATVIAFTCSKGGVGKTTVSVTFALLLVSLGYKVQYIDTDPQATGSNYFTERARLLIAKRKKELEKEGADEETIEKEIAKLLEQLPKVIDKKSGLEFHLKQVAYDFDYIIVDTQGANTSITREAQIYSDWIYVLFSYSGFDVKALEATMSDIIVAQSFNKISTKIFLLPNMVEKRNTVVNAKGKEKAQKIISDVLNLACTTAEERNIYFLNTEISYKSAYSEMDGGKSIFELTKGKTLDPSIEYDNLLVETVSIVKIIENKKEAA